MLFRSTPISKVEAYAISHGWYQGYVNGDVDDPIPRLIVEFEGSRIPWIVIIETFDVTFKINNSQRVMSISVDHRAKEG